MKSALKKRNAIYQGFYDFSQVTIEHETHSGGTLTIEREVMKKPDGVIVLPYDPVRNIVVMVEQFRIGAFCHNGQDNNWLLELPAGMADKEGESIESLAIRELEEETGLIADVKTLQPVHSYFSTPGCCNEILSVFYIEVDSGLASDHAGCADEHEDIKVHKIPLGDCNHLIAQGRIKDASSIIGLLWLQNRPA